MSLDWKVSESTVFRLVRKIENILIKSRRFSLPGKKKLLDSSLDAVEHVNRRLKIFKILSYPYRNRHKRFGLRSNLIAGLYNYELA